MSTTGRSSPNCARFGIDVRLHQLAGPWPEGDASTHATLARALRAAPACLVDGIVGCGSPEVVVAAVESGHAVTIMVHLPIGDEFGLEPARSASGTPRWRPRQYAPRPGCCARAAGLLPS